MTEEQFERNYPKDQYKYVYKHGRKKGPMDETEIDTYDIVSIQTGETIITATRTEHTNLRGLNTTINWDW